ncbi:hypothetical protein MNBD_ALPHA12-532, partial [hydrothermal vent metagenome]
DGSVSLGNMLLGSLIAFGWAFINGLLFLGVYFAITGNSLGSGPVNFIHSAPVDFVPEQAQIRCETKWFSSVCNAFRGKINRALRV